MLRFVLRVVRLQGVSVANIYDRIAVLPSTLGGDTC